MKKIKIIIDNLIKKCYNNNVNKTNQKKKGRDLTMANSKMTKKDWYAVLKELVEKSNAEQKAELLEFIAHEVELLVKKSAKSGMTDTQKKNVGVVAEIEIALAEMGKPVTISELMTCKSLAGYSNQKLSALLRQMIEKGPVVRTEDKRKAYFALAQ